MKRTVPLLLVLAACGEAELDVAPDAGTSQRIRLDDDNLAPIPLDMVAERPCWERPDPPPGCEPPDPDPDPDPPPPPPPLPPGDDDRDGITDSYEDELLRRFAPRIWLDRYEHRFPVNVRYLLERSTMRYSHARCPDHLVIPYGQVTRETITEQTHRSARDLVTFPPWNACKHHGSSHSSSHYPPDDRKDTFFLQYDDGAHSGLQYSTDWQLYGHVYRTSTGNISIQYWQLYAYNDSAASANHEGDWEYTGVILDADETVHNVVFYRHGRRVVENPGKVEWEGVHHVTYASKGGHGQYRGRDLSNDQGECLGEGNIDQAQGFADNCSQGFRWDSWTQNSGGIINVGERDRPLNDSEWLRYSGLWGEIGAAADVLGFTSGPPGPAWQSTWTSD